MTFEAFSDSSILGLSRDRQSLVSTAFGLTLVRRYRILHTEWKYHDWQRRSQGLRKQSDESSRRFLPGSWLLCIGIPSSGRTLTGVEVCENCEAPFYGLG